MKNKNIETIVAFETENNEFRPVKNAISEELQEIVNKVYQLDNGLGYTLDYLTGVMMRHFHENVARVNYGDLSPIERKLNELSHRIEKARLALFKAGYTNDIKVDNPMWYLNMALSDIELIRKLGTKER